MFSQDLAKASLSTVVGLRNRTRNAVDPSRKRILDDQQVVITLRGRIMITWWICRICLYGNTSIYIYHTLHWTLLRVISVTLSKCYHRSRLPTKHLESYDVSDMRLPVPHGNVQSGNNPILFPNPMIENSRVVQAHHSIGTQNTRRHDRPSTIK
jgi:hypothetical protein